MGIRGVALAQALAFCRQRLGARSGRPLVLGISGPQGGGKSTLAAGLVAALAGGGVRAISISIDDFYLTHQEQLALASRYPGNRYLAYRGYPGTHDVSLGTRTLDTLIAGLSTHIPSYDKAAHAGRGDRAPPDSFRGVSGPLDLLIFEGWMVGFSPAPAALLEDPALEAPNRMLADYAPWNQRLDALVLLVAEEERDIVAWRVDAERARREAGQGGLSDEDARDYIERFLPAYRLWVPGLLGRSEKLPSLVIRLGRDREPAR